MERRKRVHPTDHSKQREFDVLCVGEKVVLWNETKATARQDYIDGFVAALPEFFEYFPDYGGRTLIPIFASLHLSAETIQYSPSARSMASPWGMKRWNWSISAN